MKESFISIVDIRQQLHVKHDLYAKIAMTIAALTGIAIDDMTLRILP